ncbi:MAG: polysaccharide biosynthesis/export family protein [Planctomycetota bacterium]
MKPHLLCTLALLASCVGCSWGKPLPELAPLINKTLDRAVVKISPRDVLTIQFNSRPEWTQAQITVDLEGNASFLGLDEPMQVEGMTIKELTRELVNVYSQPRIGIANPQISISIRTFAARQITMAGEVRRTGPMDASSGKLTLVEALGAAAPSEYAETDNILLLRWSAEQQKQLAWRIDVDENYWHIAEPLYLQPRDVVFVPRKGIGYLNRWVDHYIRRLLPFGIPSPLTGL